MVQKHFLPVISLSERLCSEVRRKRTSLWVVLGDVGLGQVVNYLLLHNFGVIDEEFGAFIQQVFSNVDTRRLPGVATQTHTRLSPLTGVTLQRSVDRWGKRSPVSASMTLRV